MPRVLISDDLSPRAVEIFRERGVEVDVRLGLKPDELKAIIGAYDGLAVRSSTKVTKPILEAAPNLKVVGRAGIGVDNIDVPGATARGVVVMNTPFGNSITTAEHAIALILALARDIPAADRSTQAGKWEKSRFMGVELTAKTLGIIGCGNIGSIVASRALGLRMKVVAFDPFLSEDRAVELGVEKAELDELYRRADFITLHTPLTDSTRNLIDRVALAKMKPGVRIVNCARGGLIVEEDLVGALDSGHVAAAALDVFATEPARESPLFGRDNVVCTPHLGASTLEAQENVALQVAEQMADFLLTGAVVNALNMPSLTAEEATRLKPYMKLAELLGSFAGQMLESGLDSVTIEYAGHVAALNTKPLTAVALTGLLRPMTETVNMVNAPVLCRERGINVTEAKLAGETDFQTRVGLRAIGGGREIEIVGSLFGGDKPRIVSVLGIELEAELGANVLFVRNHDKPGFIGNLGRTLGDAGINIATFHLGRLGAAKDAVALVQVDQNLDAAILDAVRRIPNVLEVKGLKF
jgi:D-3-phosphoglycerate dehydrogenase